MNANTIPATHKLIIRNDAVVAMPADYDEDTVTDHDIANDSSIWLVSDSDHEMSLAIEYVAQMSADDLAAFTVDAWRDGVSNMQSASEVDALADTDGILDAMEDLIEAQKALA